MPSILCIETSSVYCSVALFDGKTLHIEESQTGQNHAGILNRLIRECLEKARMDIKDLNAVAISEGPGSYTGLRIGASTAKGLCFALDIPLIPVNTLLSMAWGVKQLKNEYQGLIWVMTDARRMEVYHRLFDHNLIALTETVSGILQAEGFVPDTAGKEIVLCGDGAVKAEKVLKIPIIDIIPHARYLYQLALDDFENNKFASIETFQPFYLKEANITVSTKIK